MASICTLLAALGAEAINYGCERWLEGGPPESTPQPDAAAMFSGMLSTLAPPSEREVFPNVSSRGYSISLAPWGSAGGAVKIQFTSTPGRT